MLARQALYQWSHFCIKLAHFSFLPHKVEITVPPLEDCLEMKSNYNKLASGSYLDYWVSRRELNCDSVSCQLWGIKQVAFLSLRLLVCKKKLLLILLNELVCVKHLVQFLACSKCLIDVKYYKVAPKLISIFLSSLQKDLV